MLGTRERSKRNSSEIAREGNSHRAAVMLAGPPATHDVNPTMCSGSLHSEACLSWYVAICGIDEEGTPDATPNGGAAS